MFLFQLGSVVKYLFLGYTKKIMNKILSIIAALFISSSAMATAQQAKLKVFVTVLPQVGIVSQIAGPDVEVKALISKAGCPETYSPTPKQLQELSNSTIFIDLGLPFEATWLKKLSSSSLKTFHMTKNIKLRDMETGDEHGHNEHHHGDKDPHVWLSLKNLDIMAENTANILIEFMPESKKAIQKNLKAFKAKTLSLNKQIELKMKGAGSKNIFVMHPSYGYFADDYGLKQYPIELEGKEPTAKQLVKTTKLFKDNNASIILVQPEFSDKTAKAIAELTGATLVPISIYQQDPLKNFEELLKKWK